MNAIPTTTETTPDTATPAVTGGGAASTTKTATTSATSANKLAAAYPEVLALAVFVYTASYGVVGAMVFSLLATEVPPERRSQTLNLVYLPLYAAGIVGPAVGGTIAGFTGPTGPFWAAAAVFLAGAVVVALRVRVRQA